MKEGEYRPQPSQPEQAPAHEGLKSTSVQPVEGPPNRLAPDPEQQQKSPEAGAGPLGLPPPDPEQSPQSETSKSPEGKRRTRIVYNPRKETKEEYMKRFLQAWEQRREKLRKYNREYLRRWRKARKEQRAAALTQGEQEQPEATQIFPSPSKT